MVHMGYEWDPDKAKLNIRKHGIAFADAVSAFSDDSAITVDDNDPDEVRFATLGMDAFGRVLVVVYTWRADNIRLISARRPPRKNESNMEGER